MRRFHRGLLAIACTGLMAACAQNPSSDAATGVRADEQSLRLEVLDAQQLPIPGLSCRLANEHGFVSAKTGQAVTVKRSSQDLSVECDGPSGQTASAKLRPRSQGAASAVRAASTGVFGSIGLGGGGSRGGVGVNIGFPVGGISSSAPAAANDWSYPAWVQLRLGKQLLFDAQGSSPQAPAAAYQSLP